MTTLDQKITENQLEKLKLAALMPDDGDGQCAVCRNGRLSASAFVEHTEALGKELAGLRSLPAKFEFSSAKRIHELEEEIEQLTQNHRAAQRSVEEITRMLSEHSKAGKELQNLSLLAGRVEEYINSVGAPDDVDGEDEFERLVKLKESLVADLRAAEHAVGRYQNKISDDMTSLARDMEIEFKDGTAQISLTDLSIKVQIDPEVDQMTPLSEIGSGANWVCYHVAAALALHRHSSAKDTPVPRMLILDQPSQAWFPGVRETERGSKGQVLPEREDDLRRVRDLYRLIYETAKQEGFSQVIVLDHAYFADEWFEQCLVEEWRNGIKLVPEEWLSPEYQ